ncbi:tRNA pseudouridine(38/39) synthase [Zostera marina]|uniref:tRNA pseudouridine(38/39) synthase n=1 Tax=Zostera marina TaxID=29655 RepID=A0A0K9P9N1_ZOSMR|nr:tRNA pseudouridine(38/39) synthase [Zostera marina]
MESVATPHSELEYLTKRVKELERENGLFLSWMSACSHCSSKITHIPFCSKDEINFSNGSLQQTVSSNDFDANKEETCTGVQNDGSFEVPFFSMEGVEPANGINRKSIDSIKYGTKEDISGCKQRTMAHVNKRYIALKIMYFGQRFYGFSSEAQMRPTIESEIFTALERVKLVVSKKETLNYSRCGRTDRGVSSTGQVISLYVRSRCNDNCSSEKICEKEIDYVKVLNRALPSDIRVMGWCSVAPNFHSRFSCLGREYKYFFWKGTLDIEAMRSAGLKLVGEYDFRNFCKMDAANVSNYNRKITLFDISICNNRDISSNDKDQLYAITIKGTAFLWHQVRCMVSLLFFIGQGLESPTIIDLLLDTSKITRKPQYTMASDVPLVLRSCEFKGINFFCSSAARRALMDDLNDIVKSHKLQAAIFNEALTLLHVPGDYQDEHKNKKICHIPLLLRPTEPSYEERRRKLILKKKVDICK